MVCRWWEDWTGLDFRGASDGFDILEDRSWKSKSVYGEGRIGRPVSRVSFDPLAVSRVVPSSADQSKRQGRLVVCGLCRACVRVEPGGPEERTIGERNFGGPFCCCSHPDAHRAPQVHSQRTGSSPRGLFRGGWGDRANQRCRRVRTTPRPGGRTCRYIHYRPTNEERRGDGLNISNPGKAPPSAFHACTISLHRG
jgi:hypothetical protein